MLFKVIDTETSEVLRVYDTGKRAGRVSGRYNRLASSAGVERRTRVVQDADADDTWKTREASRFLDGTYQRLPWFAPGFPWFRNERATLADYEATYPHASTDEPGKVAYTPDATYGVQDRQVRTTPGKFLRKFFDADAMPDSEIERLSAKLTAGSTYDLADTPEDITTVYKHGPSSCMSYDDYDYECDAYPVEVYGAGDLAVAYTGDIDDALARCLVWPDRQIYARCYGKSQADMERLKDLLTADGYRHGSYGEWEGAKLLRIEEYGGRIVMPYLDVVGSWGEHPDGVHLQIGGPHSADTTNGYARHIIRCADCSREIDPNYDGYRTLRDEHYCMGCATDCNECYDAVRYEDARTLAGPYGDRHICEYCADEHEECSACGDVTRDSVTLDDGRTYCHEAGCSDDNIFYCEQGAHEAHVDDVSDVEDPNGWTQCITCADEHEEDTAGRLLHAPRDMHHHTQTRLI